MNHKSNDVDVPRNTLSSPQCASRAGAESSPSTFGPSTNPPSPKTAVLSVPKRIVPASMNPTMTAAISGLLPELLKNEAVPLELISADNERCWQRINDPNTSPQERELCYKRLASNDRRLDTENSERRKYCRGVLEFIGSVIAGSAISLICLRSNMPCSKARK